MATENQFLREYVKAIRDGNAAIFAGAGLSRPSGYVTWKELLRPLAEDIGLNIDEENDLTAVAQFVRNKAGNRGNINDTIIEAFSKEAELNQNIEILTRLPIYTYWTTNYDRLLEEGLRKANRKPDTKIFSNQLASTIRDRDAVVYKMHGDVEHAAEAVLTKDDYAQYDKKHPLFRNVLMGDLVSKTFLFIGFSFEDPNLDCVLSQIRLLLADNLRNHYCFMKRIKRHDCANDEDYGYRKAREELREEDLKRYGIQTVFVDEYEDITSILSDVETAVLKNNIFISASNSACDEVWTEERISELGYKLANSLVKEEFRVTSGFGLNFGSSVINGALDEIYKSKYKHIDEHLCLRPFPQGIANENERKAKWKKYREDILSENGVAVFLFGNRKDDLGNIVVADGCIQEFEIAQQFERIIIPIGSTGYAAKNILNKVKEMPDSFSYLNNYLERLEHETEIDSIVSMVLEIVKGIRKF